MHILQSLYPQRCALRKKVIVLPLSFQEEQIISTFERKLPHAQRHSFTVLPLHSEKARESKRWNAFFLEERNLWHREREIT